MPEGKAVGLEVEEIEKASSGNFSLACLLGQRTTAGNPWIAQRLAMARSGSVSRLVTAAAKHPPTTRELAKRSKLLKCDT